MGRASAKAFGQSRINRSKNAEMQRRTHIPPPASRSLCSCVRHRFFRDQDWCVSGLYLFRSIEDGYCSHSRFICQDSVILKMDVPLVRLIDQPHTKLGKLLQACGRAVHTDNTILEPQLQLAAAEVRFHKRISHISSYLAMISNLYHAGGDLCVSLLREVQVALGAYLPDLGTRTRTGICRVAGVPPPRGDPGAPGLFYPPRRRR